MHKVNKDGLEYYMIDRIEDIQIQMLNLLKVVDRICRDNNLQYLLDGGTAIGAYRHGGFIPWDDDLDICLPKSDYLKLIAELKKMDRTRYFLFDYELKRYPCNFFGERIPFFACRGNKKWCIYPIKIDIIPLNSIKNDSNSIVENRIHRELSNLIFFGNCSAEYFDRVQEFFQSKYDSNPTKFMHYYNTEYGLAGQNDNTLLVRPSMKFSTPNLYGYSNIFPLKEILFSGMKSYVPNTDIMLKDIYGDYMSFPELSGRKPEARKVFSAKKNKRLYDYLLDRNEKTLAQKIKFAIQAELCCK